MALKLVMEPIFESGFYPSSYAYRPGRRCQDAIAEIYLFAIHSYEPAGGGPLLDRQGLLPPSVPPRTSDCPSASPGRYGGRRWVLSSHPVNGASWRSAGVGQRRPRPRGDGRRVLCGRNHPPTTGCGPATRRARTPDCLIWRVFCQGVRVNFSLLALVGTGCGGSAGWVAVRVAVRDAGQTDMRGSGWPQDHGSSWGAAVYGIERRPVPGCS